MEYILPFSLVTMASKKSDLSAESIEEWDRDKETKPTREDVRSLLDKHEDQLFFFNINYNPPEGEPNTREKINYKEIENFLRETFTLYKLKSDKDKQYSLNRSMFIGLIKGEGKPSNDNISKALCILMVMVQLYIRKLSLPI